jgi:uncharacterized protein
VEKSSTSPPSPLSPTLWPASAFSLGRSGAFLLLLAVAYLLGQGLALAVLYLWQTLWHTPIVDANRNLQLNAPVIFAQLTSYVPLVVVLVRRLPYAAARSLGELGLRRPRWADVVAAIIGTFAMIVATTAAGAFQKALFHLSGTAKDIELFNTAHDPAIVWTFVIVAAAIAPIIEEVLFRGFLFNAFLRYMPVALATTITALLFGAAHLDPVAFFPLACGGAVLCIVYYRTGSLTASIGTHALFNFVNISLVIFGVAKDS